MSRLSVLVTGGSGFVGGALLRHLAALDQCTLHTALRRDSSDIPVSVRRHRVEGLTASCDWSSALRGVDVVVHAAARAHVMDDSERLPIDEYRRINVDATLRLAQQALAAGVSRFIFLSSIKVNGEGSPVGNPFRFIDEPMPEDDYGLSKWEAECVLRNLVENSSMELVIIRPVLVYGPGVKANFLSLLRWAGRGVPLPLGRIKNRRSFVALDNLVDLIVRCLDHPDAPRQVLLISDGQDISIPELIKMIARLMGKRVSLWPVPITFIKVAAKLAGCTSVADRVCGSLQVDISETCKRLNWQPPVSLDQALKKTVMAYLDNKY